MIYSGPHLVKVRCVTKSSDEGGANIWRDTSVIQHQHIDALQTASQAVTDLLSALPEDVIALSSTMTEVPDDPRMQDYADKED